MSTLAFSGCATVSAPGSDPRISSTGNIETTATGRLAQPLPTTDPSLTSRLQSPTTDAAVANPAEQPASDPADRVPGDLNPALRNRLADSVGPGEEPEFNYPDIHEDPGKTYHDRYGIQEDHDPFLFPWLMNLIFEDRWLLAEEDPEVALQNQLRRRMKVDIRDPQPDLANFPNSPYTLPKGRLYIENSPLSLLAGSKNEPRTYQWEYLIRYGLTDNLELRIFSDGLTWQAKQGNRPAATGYSPMVFDFKANFWEENTKYHIPAVGVEMFVQTTFGSSRFNRGTQPSLSVLFEQSLPLGIEFEYNVGITGTENGEGQIVYEFSFQWSFQREVFKDFDLFVHGFYNAATLPRLIDFESALPNQSIPNINVVGVGAIWTVSNRLSIFGSYNFGTTTESPRTIALTGFAVAF
jgi:Putative MetA-pathway of phenol degradation